MHARATAVSFALHTSPGHLAEAPQGLARFVVCTTQVLTSQQHWAAVEPDSKLRWTREKLEALHSHLLVFGGAAAADQLHGGSTRVIDLSGWDRNAHDSAVSLCLSPPRRGLNLGLSLPRAAKTRAPATVAYYHFAFPVPKGADESDASNLSADEVEIDVEKRLRRQGDQDWKTWVETRHDLACPLCGAYIAKSESELFAHLRTCHPQLRFEAFLDEGHRMHCVVQNLRHSSEKALRPKRKRDEKFCPLYVHKRQRDARFTLYRVPLRDADTRTGLSASKKAQGKIVAKPSSNRSSFAPVRQYYHSRTYLPLLPSEVDIDSDEELDDDWMQQESERLINEFEDVAPEEILLMKLWNRHTRSHKVQADNRVPHLLRLFAKRFAPTIVRENLWEVFLLHAFNLWDNSLVTKDEVLECAAVVRNYSNSVADRGETEQSLSNGSSALDLS
eukprot:scaffold3504_cov240-Pinguiococcus_pyrenoidosus.AAC.16